MNNVTARQSANSAVVNPIPDKSSAKDVLPTISQSLVLSGVLRHHDGQTETGFDPDILLTSCEVLLVSEDYHSLKLSAGFWEEDCPFSLGVMKQIEMDLNH